MVVWLVQKTVFDAVEQRERSIVLVETEGKGEGVPHMWVWVEVWVLVWEGEVVPRMQSVVLEAVGRREGLTEIVGE